VHLTQTFASHMLNTKEARCSGRHVIGVAQLFRRAEAFGRVTTSMSLVDRSPAVVRSF